MTQQSASLPRKLCRDATARGSRKKGMVVSKEAYAYDMLMCFDVLMCCFFFLGGNTSTIQHVWLFKVQVEPVFFEHRNPKHKHCEINDTHGNNMCHVVKLCFC